MPSMVAVIVAAPGATAVTSPADETVAIAGALVDQVATFPAIGALLASSGVAWSCRVRPVMMVAVVGVTATEPPGGVFTAMVAVPAIPSMVAVIVAAPVATAVTTPAVDTVATVAALEAHVT